MNIVSFPGLGFKFNVNKIAFKIFGIPIYMYGVCIVLGIIISLFLCRLNRNKFEIKYDYIVETIVEAIIIGIFGARLYYVVFSLNYFIKNPIEIIHIRDGGLAIYGGLIFGLLTICMKCKKNNVNIMDFLDCIIPYVPLAQSVGRWGNFFNIEAYGYETKNFLRMGINTSNGYIEVHPVFLYESICNIIIFFILINLQKKRKFKGQIFYLYLAMYSGIRMFFESLRIDSLMLYNFRISQILSIIVFLCSIILLLKKRIKNNIKDLK